MSLIRILPGDCHEVLKLLPAESVHCVITSPPYFGLRDYGVAGQIGLEALPDEFIAVLVRVFREVRRVLRSDGTLWLNLGDSYASASTYNAPRTSGGAFGRVEAPRQPNAGIPAGYKAKDLLMIPARVALALQADGWWLRSDIIWHKPNPMPESVTDRPTNAHEHVFLLSKSARYFYDAEAVREPSSNDGTRPQRARAEVIAKERGLTQAHLDAIRACGVGDAGKAQTTQTGFGKNIASVQALADEAKTVLGGYYREFLIGTEKNLRNVWTIATAPFSEAHFATFPPALVEPCIKAGTSERGCCPACGAPWGRVAGRDCEGCGEPIPVQGKACPGCGHVRDWKAGRSTSAEMRATDWSTPGKGTPRLPGGFSKKTSATGWSPSCSCPLAAAVPCTVLDPFGGAGTVGMVAGRLQRNAVLIELRADYVEMARQRLSHDLGLIADVRVEQPVRRKPWVEPTKVLRKPLLDP